MANPLKKLLRSVSKTAKKVLGMHKRRRSRTRRATRRR